MKPTNTKWCGLALALMCAAPAIAVSQTPVPVLTWRYDLTHAGQNTHETELTPSNVNPTAFGKLFSYSVDSTVYAQPLYVPGLKMSDGLIHNVLFIATENDSIYAFDADSNGGANAKPLWQVSLLTSAHGAGSGATAVPWGDTGSPDVAPTIGITGTPTIDPATNTMYVVANTKESGAYFSRLHAINIISGAEQAHSPVNITATVDGTGHGSSGGKLSFSALWENQRTALDLYNGYVIFGYAAHGDNGNWHGWLFSYNATTLQQNDVLCLSPNGYGAGLWASGAGLPIDDDVSGGRMFASTGNGTHDTFPPFNASSEYGQSILSIGLANGKFTPLDGFTSYNFQDLNDHDLDQGSGGVLMVPDQQGSHPHVLVNVGKEGRILVLDRDKLGGFNNGGSSNPGAVQDITGETQGVWNTPAYWNGNVYLWGNKDIGRLFKMNSGVLDEAPSSQTSFTSQFPSPSFSISSNGTENGIAWAVRSDQFNTDGPAVLYAWEANELSKPIYESDTNSSRDAAGPANKFSIPMVTNGKVYVVTHGEVDVYGLFHGTSSTATPKITPDGGTFSSTQSVTLSSATSNSEIFYTLDGSTPTPASKVYSGPISIGTDTTLRAIASAPGYIQSAVTSATFTFTNQVPPLSIKPAGGTYSSAQTVTITDSDTSAKIYYTTDGSNPTTSSHLYAAPFKVALTETIKAIAVASGLHNSDVATEEYAIQAGGSTINFGSGFSSTTGLTLNGSAIATNDTRLQLTEGGLWEGGSVWWNKPINIHAFTTDFEFQLSLAQGNGFTFTIQNMGTTALGGDSAGLGYQDIQKSVAVKFNFYNYENEGDDSTGVYTDGEPPVTPTVDITPSGIQLGSGDSIKAQITYDGTTLTLHLLDLVSNKTFTYSKAINIPSVVGANTAYVGFTGGTGGLSSSQKILTWTYTTQAIPPTFSPAGGSYSTAQNVTLRSGTSDASIYYTKNGATPNAGSTHYTGAIAVSSSETLKAIAISPTVGSSNVVSAGYTIKTAAAFALAATAPKTMVTGGSATSTITVTPQGGFTGNVALKCALTAKPSGAVDAPTCTVTQPATITGTTAVHATLTVKSVAGTTSGSYTFTVSGSSGSISGNVAVTFTVTGKTFKLSGSKITIPAAGKSATTTITVSPEGGFTGKVAIQCAITGHPAGAVDPPTCTVSQPSAIEGSGPVTFSLTINTQAKTTPGAYTVALNGSSGGVAKGMFLTVDVQGPGFAMSGTAIAIAKPGESVSTMIAIAPRGGFHGSVSLRCAITSKPAGAVDVPTCTASEPAPISATDAVKSTLTIHTQTATTKGRYTATVTGVSGELTEKTAVAINVGSTELKPTRAPVPPPGNVVPM